MAAVVLVRWYCCTSKTHTQGRQRGRRTHTKNDQACCCTPACVTHKLGTSRKIIHHQTVQLQTRKRSCLPACCPSTHARADWTTALSPFTPTTKPQVEWFAPRPVWEFFTKFNVPKNQTKWTSRLKCNLYYYRTNYLGLLLLSLAGAFVRAPLGLAASALLLTALLCFNDPFAATLK